MSGSLEEAYVAVERAYGQGDFAGALQLAEALRPQVPPGRPDLLDQRLQLLLGHIHLYGLNQPALAAVAYTAVLEGCTEPSYRELAGQGLEISRKQMPVAAEPEPSPPAQFDTPAEPAQTTAAAPSAVNTSAGQTLPATPWLNQLQDPQQALRQIQEAWATVTPSQPAAPVAAPAVGGTAASPWQPGGATAAPMAATAAAEGTDGMQEAAAAMAASGGTEPPGPAGDSPDAPEPTAAEEPATAQDDVVGVSAGLTVPAAESGDAEPDDPQAIIPVVVTVEDEETATETEPTAAAPAESEVPAAASFSEEDWADFKRGLLLVELTTSNAGPTR
ncbi:MAG: hypothetical protein ACKO5M_01560 [Vulcanococcus sp.]